jgi:multiple sugar transport system substrate-binding protein
MDAKTTTRRKMLAALGGTAAATALGSLAGCGPNVPNSSGKSSDGVRMYWWGGDLRNKMTRKAVKTFSAAHDDMSVSPEYSEWTGYWDKLATQAAGGDLPDVLQMDEAYIDSYGSKGSLLDLSEVDDVLDLSEMDDEILDTGRLADGTLVGAPLGIGIFSVGVNPTVLKKAGIDQPDDSNWTWDDMLKTSAAISEWAKEAGEDVVGMDLFGTASAELAAWARQSGEQLFPRDDEKPLGKDTVVSYLDYARALVDAGATPGPDAQIEDFNAGVEQGRFGNNQAAFHLQFHTQVQTFQASSGSPLTLSRLPARNSGDPKMCNKASMYWSISARTGARNDAATLTDFLQNSEEAAKILKIERGVPAVSRLQDAVEPLLTDEELVSLDFARDMQKEVVTPPMVTPADGVGFGDELTRLGQDSLFGRTKPSAVADELLDILGGMQPNT